MTPAELMATINLLIGIAQMPAGQIHPQQFQSLHDIGAAIVQCYHPSASYNGMQVAEVPWSRAAEWKADGSARLNIFYVGNVFRFKHTMTVALMYRGKSIMALPLGDSNPIPQARDCELKNWVSAE